MQGLEEDVMYVYQGDMTIYRGYVDLGCGYMSSAWSKLAFGHPRVALACPQKPPTARLLTPNNRDIFILAVITNGSH